MFKPGQSGNPKGRPPQERTLAKALKDVLNEESVDYKGKKISGKEACARKLFELAMSGNAYCLRYIYDRVEGMPRQMLDVDLGTKTISIIPAPAPETLADTTPTGPEDTE